MKKVIAFITALTTLSCLLVGCGSSGSDDESSSKKSKKSSSSDSSSYSTTKNTDDDEDEDEEEEEETTKKSKKSKNDDDDEDEEVTTKNKTTKNDDDDYDDEDDYEDDDEDEEDDADDDDENDGEYMDVLEDTIDALNNEDYVTIMENMLPSVVIDIELELLEEEGVGIEELAEELGQLFTSAESKGKKILPIKLGKVTDESMSDDELDEFNGIFEEMLNDDEVNIDESDIPEITDAYNVTAEYKLASGEKNPVEMVAYYVDGEGWKVDMGMFSYVRKSKQASANSTASSIQKSAESALTDLDAKDYNLKGKYIICSDRSKNYNVPSDFPLDEMDKYMKNYFSKLDKVDYIVYIEGGSAVFVA